MEITIFTTVFNFNNTRKLKLFEALKSEGWIYKEKTKKGLIETTYSFTKII